MKKLGLSLLVAALAGIMILSGCSQSLVNTATPSPSASSQTSPKAPTSTTSSTPTTATPTSSGSVIRLKAVSFQAANASSTGLLKLYITAVNEKGKGKVQIDYLGGPEIASRDAAPQAARTGTLDVVYEPFTFYGGIVPIGNAMQFSDFSAKEEIANGLWDFVRELHAKAGLYWLGRANSVQSQDTLWNSVKPVSKIADLAGQRAGSGSLTSKALVEKVGAAFVQVAVGEVFTSMQTGVIDSYIAPANGQVAASAHKAGKYIINHPFYKANQSLFMGLNKWNTLPKDVQDILTSTLVEMQDKLNEQFTTTNQADLQKMLEAGEKLVEFSKEEGELFVKMANESAKADVIRDYGEAGKKILELTSKTGKP